MSVQILRDVPDSEVDQIVKDLESKGCSVEKVKQLDGKWTVQATCPERSSLKSDDN